MRRIAISLFLLALTLGAYAQEDSTKTDTTFVQSPELNFEGDTFIPAGDSLPSNLSTEVINPMDTIQKKEAEPPSKKNDIETTINYTAKDSMIFDIKGQKLYLYGDTHIDYGNISLEAEQTSINWNNRTIASQFRYDTLGRKRGKPVFSQGSDVYETDDILYNFKTKRALIKGVITEQDGAFMHGENVKKNGVDELFIRGAKYTTCNLSDPHFFIESSKLKVIPGNKVVSGPFNLKFREVPTPLWFPFGMFPQPKEKASGIIFPTYGEERQRGFFLRNAGYYFGFSDYFDLRLTGDIYSKGGHAVDATSNYKVRYKFNGSLNLSYNKNISDDVENPLETNDYWIRWSHRPETRGNSSFSASVSAGTSSYNNNNNLVNRDFERSINSQFASSISYNQRFRNLPFNISSNLRHNQNIRTGVVSMTLPDFSLNVNRIYPFKDLVKSSKSPISKISFSHNFVAKNEITNAAPGSFPFAVTNEKADSEEVIPFSLDNIDQIYDRAKIGGRHSIPVSTSFNLLKYFTVSPAFNYTDLWYTRELDFEYIEEKNAVRVDTIEGFSRAGSWNSSVAVNTRMYGMYYIRGIEAIEAIRHVITPSISMSYNPDFSDESRGVYKTIQVDSTGRTRRVSKYEGFAYGSPTGSENRSLNFSLTNNIEMKVRSRKDTVNEFKKVKLFDNLSINSGYNFAADSFKLRNLGWSARTSFFNNKVSLALSGNFDPYMYIEDGTTSGRKIDRYAWNNGQGLGTLSSLNTAIRFTLKPKDSKGRDSNTTQNDAIGNDQFGQSAFDENGNPIDNSLFGTEDEKGYIKANPEEYVDFNVPWSLSVSYNIARSKRGLGDPQITSHGAQFNGSLGLTGKTQITFNSGYDLKNKAFTTTRIGVTRDLHCWTLSFSYVPFGRLQSFALTIRPKSALLQDLKIERKRSFIDFF